MLGASGCDVSRISTASTLGALSVTDRAEAATALIHGLPPKQREAWEAVTRYMAQNAGATAKAACDACGINPSNYYLACKKAEATGGEAFKSFHKTDMIRPGDKILEMAPHVTDDEEARRERETASRQRLAEATKRVSGIKEAAAVASVALATDEAAADDTPEEPAALTLAEATAYVFDLLHGWDMADRRRVLRAAAILLDVEL